MSIAVMDCMKLPALQEAKIAAGEKGMTRPVTAVTVIEDVNISVMTNKILIGNELLISALSSIREDVEMQCRLVRHLHSLSEAGLVLYYVGVYLPELDQRLLDTAEELDFPIIVMPQNRFDFRYSDLITEVMELVIMDRKQETYYVPSVVNRISKILPQYRTMSSVLRLLSDQLHCTLILSDHYFSCKAAATWPVSNQWNYQDALDQIREVHVFAERPVRMDFEEKSAFVWELPILSAQKQDIRLILLDEQGIQNRDSIRQAGEVTELFLNLWYRDVQYQNSDILIQAIFNDQPLDKNRIAANMNIDIASIHTVWMLNIIQDGEKLTPRRGLKYVLKLKQFLQAGHKLVIVDFYEEYLIALIDDSVFDETEFHFMSDFIESISSEEIKVKGVIAQNMENSTQVRASYLMMKENLSAASCIFPEKNIFTAWDMQFAEECSAFFKKGEKAIAERLSCLSPLRGLADREELLQTLCTYLLDTNTNMQNTGKLLHLHKNTVKYRLNKMKQILRCDFTQVSELLEYYQAAALYRLLRKS